MKLSHGAFGPYYACTTRPACPGTHGAHRDGRPLGTPADFETKQMRKAAHAAFDPLWDPPEGGKPYFKDRGAAYRWIQTIMGLDAEKAHIGMFDRDQCRKLIEATWSLSS